MAMQATAARDGRGSSGRARCQPAAAGSGSLYAAGWLNDAPCTLQSVADRPIVDGGTHTMPVSAAIKQPTVRSTPEGTCGITAALSLSSLRRHRQQHGDGRPSALPLHG